MISREHFGPYLRNRIFPKYRISARIKQIIWTFFIDQIQNKLMTKFSKNPKKPFFWPIFGRFSSFLGQKFFLKKNAALSRITAHRPLTTCWVSEKNSWAHFKKTSGQKDWKTEGRKNGRMEGRKVRP